MDLDLHLERAQKKLIDAVQEARDSVPANASEDRVMHYALEAMTSVVPSLPDAITNAVDQAMGSAHGRIFTRNELRAFLAKIFVDMLVQQTYAISRWMRVRRRTPNNMEMSDDHDRALDRRSRSQPA